MINALYILAIICPPLAILLCGRFTAALFACFLCLLLWVPGIIFAMLIIRDFKMERRIKKYSGQGLQII